MKSLILLVLFGCVSVAIAQTQTISLGQTCYSATGGYGTVTVPANTILTSITLTYVSGWLSCCAPSCTGYNWGCGLSNSIQTIITDNSANVLIPQINTNYYTVDRTYWGYSTNTVVTSTADPVLTLPFRTNPFFSGSSAATLRIYYTESYTSYTLGDNAGTTCANVSASVAVAQPLGTVCFGAAVGTSGVFNVPPASIIHAFQFTRVSGNINSGGTCGASNWGCAGHPTSVNIYITNGTVGGTTAVIVPEFISGFYILNPAGATFGFYYFNGTSHTSTTLLLPLSNGPMSFPVSRALRIFYGEDYLNQGATDNSGTICVNATAIMSNSTCNIPIPFLSLPLSGLNNGNLSLTVGYGSGRYLSVVAAFEGASGVCSSDNAATWWGVPNSIANCTLGITITNSLNNMISNCSFRRDESSPSDTTFSSNLLVTTVQSGSTIRGVPTNTTTVTVITVFISMSTFLNTSTNPSVSGSVIETSAIQRTTFDITSVPPVLTLFLVTSVQFPYQLSAPTIASAPAFTESIVAVVADSVVTTAAACNDSTGVGTTCTQLWRIVLTPVASCPSQSNFTFSGWSVTFTVGCHSSFTGSCSTPSPSTDTLTFDTASDNYCPRIITNAAVPSATITPFSNAQFTTPQASFVFGTRSFFQVTVNSPVQVSNVAFERISITAGGAAGVTDLYTKPFISSIVSFNSTGTFLSNFDSAPTLMTVRDVNTSATLQANASFSLTWSSALSSATGDTSVTTTLWVQLRVRYANVTTVSMNDQLLTVKLPYGGSAKPRPRTLASTASFGSGVQFTVSANPAGTVPPTSTGPVASASSSSAMPSSTTLAAVAVVAAVALAVAIVIGVMVKKRIKTSSLPRTESTQEMVSVENTTDSSVSSRETQPHQTGEVEM